MTRRDSIGFRGPSLMAIVGSSPTDDTKRSSVPLMPEKNLVTVAQALRLHGMSELTLLSIHECLDRFARSWLASPREQQHSIADLPCGLCRGFQALSGEIGENTADALIPIPSESFGHLKDIGIEINGSPHISRIIGFDA